MVLTDALRYPFSLVSETKRSPGDCKVQRTGDVSDTMDKGIGRPVIKIRGTVSANNHIDYEGLNLTGQYVYIQLRLLNPSIATFHLEIVTTQDISLRLTVSTLYAGDSARFLGRSLRLPLPVQQGWMLVVLDMNRIVEEFCFSGSSKQPIASLKAIKRVQLCSNMLVRDVVTTNKLFPPGTKFLPRELAIISQTDGEGAMTLVDIAELAGGASSVRSPSSSPIGMRRKIRPRVGVAEDVRREGGVEDGTEERFEPIPLPPFGSRLSASAAAEMRSAVLSADTGTPLAYKLLDLLGPADRGPSVESDGRSSNQSQDDRNREISRNEEEVFPTKIVAPISKAKVLTPTVLASNGKSASASVAAASSAAKKKPVGVTTGYGALSSTGSPTRSRTRKSSGGDSNGKSEVSAATVDSPSLESNDTQSLDIQAGFTGDEPRGNLQEVPAPQSQPQSEPQQRRFVAGPVASKQQTPSSLLRRAPQTTYLVKDSAPSLGLPTTGSSVDAPAAGSSGPAVFRGAVSSRLLTSTGGSSRMRSPPARLAATQSGAVVRPGLPSTKPFERVLAIERVLSYSGGPALLLHEGKLIMNACGNLLILIDVEGSASTADLDNPGFWKAFKSYAEVAEQRQRQRERDKNDSGHVDEAGFAGTGSFLKAPGGPEQTFLRGHTASIGLLEMSPNGQMIASAETCARGNVFLWNVAEGRRLISLKPHSDSIAAVAFSEDNSLLVTAGTDQQRRVQIIVWDMQSLATQTPQLSIVARQISEFHISKIRFSPFEDLTLVSCGRENIRFFRMRKGCLPARPVLLNEFARGFVFSDIAFHAESGPMPLDGRRPCALFSSNRGMLLKVDCNQKVVLCAYQLHSGAIRSLAVHSGYAVTGGADNRLRVWPLDFSDFLLEAQHEAAVSSVCVAQSGRKLSVGTTAGTLGILDVSEHSYNTVLRSHVGSVSFAVARGPATNEFATIGNDRTIRLWDVLSAQQKFEFNSPTDEPLCAAFHPSQYRLACGFKSGTLRVFDVETTTTVIERRKHKAPVTSLLFVKALDFPAGCKHFTVLGGVACSASSTVAGLDAAADAVASTAASDPAAADATFQSNRQSGDRRPTSGYLLLFTAALDGEVVVYDAERDYEPLKVLTAISVPCVTVRLALSADHGLIAVAGSSVNSIVVYDTQKLQAVYRGGQLATAPSPAAPECIAPGMALSQSQSQSLFQTSRSATSIAASSASPFSMTAGTTGVGTVKTDGSGRPVSSDSATQQQTAPVTGIAFCDDRPGGSLLVTTDKHIVSLPMEAEQASGSAGETDMFGRPRRPKTAWELRSVRRLEFGSPQSMMRDPGSGLLFLTIKAPEESLPVGIAASRGKGASATPGADSVGVVAARHKANRPERLSISAAQLYQDHPGRVNGVCACTPAGRVVTFDDSGCLVIWRLLREKVNTLQASDSPAYSAGTTDLQAAMKSAPNTPQQPSSAARRLNHGDGEEENGHEDDAIADVASAILAGVKKRATGPRPPKPEKYPNKYERKARDMIRDFEIAVKEDPHVWSAGPATMETGAGEGSPDAFPAPSALDVDGTGPKKAFRFSQVRIDRAGAESLELVLQQEMSIADTYLTTDDPAESHAPEGAPAFEEDPENLVSEDNYDDDDDDDNDEADLEAEEEAIAGLDAWLPVVGDEEVSTPTEGDEEQVQTQEQLSAADLEKRRSTFRDALELLVARIRRRRRSGLAGLSQDAHDGAAPAPMSATGWARLGLLSTPAPPECSALYQMSAKPPSFCVRRKTLLVCDGSAITLRTFDLRGDVDVLLPAPCASGLPPPAYVSSFGETFTVASLGAVTGASLSPSGLFAAAVVDVTIRVTLTVDNVTRVHKDEGDDNCYGDLYGESDLAPHIISASKEVYVWFHDLASPRGEWVCLGPMGLPLLAAESAAGSVDSTGFISCSGQPGGCKGGACGIAIDWLPDDTLVAATSVLQRAVAVQVPVNACSVAKGRSGAKKGTTPGGTTKKRCFDFLLTALSVEDIFAGGFTAGAFASCSAKTTSTTTTTTVKAQPTVAVLRDNSNDLLGARCIPLTNADSLETPLEGRTGNSNVPVAPAGVDKVALVLWAGSRISVVSFSARSEGASSSISAAAPGDAGDSEYSAMFADSSDTAAVPMQIGACFSFLPVGPLYFDDVGVRGPLMGLDVSHHYPCPWSPPSGKGPAGTTAAPTPTLILSAPRSAHTAVASLDSFGNVKVGLIPHDALQEGPAKAKAQSRTSEIHLDQQRSSHSMHIEEKKGVSSASAVAQPLRSAYARMPAGCSSGTLRSISLSGRDAAAGNGGPSYCLVLGSSTSVTVRVFSLTLQEPALHDTNIAAPLMCHLTLLYKVSAPFVPDHILQLPLLPALSAPTPSGPFPAVDDDEVEGDKENEGVKSANAAAVVSSKRCQHWTPDMLLLGKRGGMAFVPSAGGEAGSYATTDAALADTSAEDKFRLLLTSGQAVDASESRDGAAASSRKDINEVEKEKDAVATNIAAECLELRSSIGPFGSAAPQIATVGSVVALLHTNLGSHSHSRIGKLQLIHQRLGVELPFPNPTGLHRGTCLAASTTLLAVGSDCGGVSLYSSSDMKMAMLIPAHVDPLVQASSAPATAGGLRSSRESDGFPRARPPHKAAAVAIEGLAKLPHFVSGGRLFAKPASRPEMASSVLAMKFICRGAALVVLHVDGRLTVTDVSAARDVCRGTVDGDDEWDAATVHPTLSNTLTTVVPLDLLAAGGEDGRANEGVAWGGQAHGRSKGTGGVDGGPRRLIASCCGHSSRAADENIFAIVRGSSAVVFRVELTSACAASSVEVGADLQVRGLGLARTVPSAIACGVKDANNGSSATKPPAVQSPPRVHPVVLLSFRTNKVTEILPVNSSHAIPVKAKPVVASSLKGSTKPKKGSKRVEIAAKEQEKAVEETPAVVTAYQTPQYERPLTEFSEELFPATAPQFHGEGAHIMLDEHELTLFLVAGRDDEEDRQRLRETGYPLPLEEQLHLFCGSVAVDDLPLAGIGRASRWPTASVPMSMHPVLNLGSQVSSLSFRGSHCALAVPEGCFLLDLPSAAEGANLLREYYERIATTKTMTPEMALMRDDDEDVAILRKPLGATDNAGEIPHPPLPEPSVRCRALAIVQSTVASATWAGGAVAIAARTAASVHDGDDDGRSTAAVSVLAYKHRAHPLLLRLDFKDVGISTAV